VPGGLYEWGPAVESEGEREILLPPNHKQGEKNMAYGIVHHFPGGTREQYETTLAAVHVGDGRLPDGQTFHAADASNGGWTVMVVHDSKESWEQFRDDILMPRMQRGIKGGFSTPPQETTVDLYKVMP
jgi:hypothetical protein